MFTTVYRIEHPETHQGPYRHVSGEYPNVRISLHAYHQDEDHPGPIEEGWENLMFDEDAFGLPLFGFTEVHQMMVWFEGFFGGLAAEGFVVSTYKVWGSAMLVSFKQCMFDAECSERVVETPIQDFIRSVDM